MTTITLDYTGHYHTRASHPQSGATLATDAPTDNGGKGEAFSPTDLLATALGSCTLTILALKAESLGIELKDTHAKVEKIMASAPRRVGQIIVDIHFNQNYPHNIRQKLEAAAKACPVAQSLNPQLQQTLRFHYPAQ